MRAGETHGSVDVQEESSDDEKIRDLDFDSNGDAAGGTGANRSTNGV